MICATTNFLVLREQLKAPSYVDSNFLSWISAEEDAGGVEQFTVRKLVCCVGEFVG